MPTNYIDYSHGALLAPGNRFSDTHVPSWAIMSEVSFQWLPGTLWKEWNVKLFFPPLGAVMLAIGVLIVLGKQWPMFFAFTPVGSYESLQLQCTNDLLFWSLMGVVASVVFIHGSNEYECGRAWLHATMTYLSRNESAEITTAMLACAFAWGSSLTIVMLWTFVDRTYHAPAP